MDAFIESFQPGYLIVGVILLFALIVLFKIIKSLSKGLIVIASLILVIFLLARYAPGVIDPMVDFVKGGWMGDDRPKY